MLYFYYIFFSFRKIVEGVKNTAKKNRPINIWFVNENRLQKNLK